MTELSVWAPFAERRVSLVLGAEQEAMTPEPGGWWSARVPVEHGTDYAFAVDGGPPHAGPALTLAALRRTRPVAVL